MLIERLTSITVDILNLRGARKVERLRAILNGQGIGTELTYFTHNIPHLLDPLISLTGINSEESFVFKSALSPLKLAFRDINDETQNVIFKRGDDCRQDQLCVQLIQLIDKLWKRENLDLRLTTYRVLATSTEIGLIEFVKSSAIADILKEHDSLRAYIAIHNPDPKGPGGCTIQSIQNFVKSCAGYSVITYLLGVGDRHLAVGCPQACRFKHKGPYHTEGRARSKQVLLVAAWCGEGVQEHQVASVPQLSA